MKLFGVEMIPHKRKITKKIKSIRLFGQNLVPQRRRTCRSSTASPPDLLPSALRQTAEFMGARDSVFVTKKVLERSDVDVGQNRFFIPKSEVLYWSVLSEEERQQLEKGRGVQVEVVDTRGRRYAMKLKKWPSLNKIVLNSGWRELVENNGLRAKVDSVELWSFRADFKLCFALNVKRENAINNGVRCNCV